MNTFLEKIGLIGHLTVELNVNKKTFVELLKKHVDERRIDTMDALEPRRFVKNDYIGLVNETGFIIRKRMGKHLLDANKSMAIAKGTYTQEDEVVLVKIEIDGSHGTFSKASKVIAIILPIMIIVIVSTSKGLSTFIAIIMFLFFAIMGLWGVYLMAKRSTINMKRDLEKEILIMIKG